MKSFELRLGPILVGALVIIIVSIPLLRDGRPVHSFPQTPAGMAWQESHPLG